VFAKLLIPGRRFFWNVVSRGGIHHARLSRLASSRTILALRWCKAGMALGFICAVRTRAYISRNRNFLRSECCACVQSLCAETSDGASFCNGETTTSLCWDTNVVVFSNAAIGAEEPPLHALK
jgi:hypothetical protein